MSAPSTPVEIVRFEVHEAAADEAVEQLLRSWWQLGRDSGDGRVYDTWPAWESAWSTYTLVNPERGFVHLLARVGEHWVGWGAVITFKQDNTHLAAVDFGVLAHHRGRGVGEAILAAAEAIAADLGRSTYLVEAYRRPGEISEREQLLLHHGYRLANLEEEKSVSVADFIERREPLEELVSRALGSYRVITYTDRCPEEYAASYAALVSTFLADIPLGELDLAPSVWTVPRLREIEQRFIDLEGEHRVVALALSPEAEVVGSSDIRWNRHKPEIASVGATQVARGHRGHALGLALKLATHNAVIEACPGLQRIITCNAQANRHMNAVNDQLGYVVHEELLELQKVV